MTARHFITILLFLFALVGKSQNTFHGQILDRSDSTPVPFAVIYLPDINTGTSCDSLGKFEIANVPGTTQKVIVTRIGYEPVTVYVNTNLSEVFIYLQKGAAELDPILVVGTQTELKDHSVTQVQSIDQHDLRSNGALSISDGVARLPGVTQLTTGAGISKPVIRGLYGNRIQSIVMGIRFDNQQWQDEHGLGLQDIGVSEVEVIKGPLALVYGSEAMGGVLNIIEEHPAPAHSTLGDFSFRGFSNTLGLAADAGIQHNNGKFYWRLRAGSESHADYLDGNNNVVWNSRFDGHVAKASLGWNLKNWSCQNNYLFSKSDFGFIMDTGNVFTDNRYARNFDNPHHTVYINLFTSQNSFFFTNSILRVNFGGHLNRRMEDEGGSGVSLDMQLLTAFIHVQYEKPLNRFLRLLTGIQSQFQNNVNYGFRVIVPNANLFEASGYAYLKYESQQTDKRHLIAEGGLRYDLRHIETFTVYTQAIQAYYIPPVTQFYNVVNGSAGVSVPFGESFTLKVNTTSGYRTPNLAELQSNGVHEGTLRYEVGDPAMKIEQNICAEAALEYEHGGLRLSATTFSNYFRNYIYLVPTDEDWFGFRIYKFIQTDAVLQGAECSIEYSPEIISGFNFAANYSLIRATTGEGNYLPFIPADRLDGSVRYTLNDHGKWKGIYFRAGVQYYFPQNRPAQFESSTADYGLADAGAGLTRSLQKNRSIELDLGCNNLLNKVYYDHLSRFKEFGIYNMGRNITLNFKYNW